MQQRPELHLCDAALHHAQLMMRRRLAWQPTAWRLHWPICPAVRVQEMCNLLLNMLCDTELQFQGGVPEAAA
jgi:hypothetical protein